MEQISLGLEPNVNLKIVNDAIPLGEILAYAVVTEPFEIMKIVVRITNVHMVAGLEVVHDQPHELTSEHTVINLPRLSLLLLINS